MRTKFSTLMASLLLASAFSTASAAAPEFPKDLKEGDFVHLELNSKRLQIVKDENGKSKLEQATSNPTWNSTNTEDQATAYIKAVNAQLWKVAKITKTSTGDKTYQFVNKLTGEYLAIDLATNDDDYRTNGTAKLNPSGNREWAFDGSNHMYAYSTSKDSTFTFDSSMRLISNPDKDATTGATAFSLDQTVPELQMTANAFNALMGLTGSNGKLNFNGGKDVTSTQTNILKNVNWEAENRTADSDATLLYLWNGKTTPGYNKDLNTTKIDRRLYLQVDTAYYDEKTPNYFKLAVDTLNYELSETGGDKPVLKHPAELAQFKATYDFITDSIGIAAQNVPVKPYSVGYEWDGTDEVGTILSQVQAYAYYADAERIKDNVDALIEGYKTWRDNTSKTKAANVKFGDAGEGKDLLDAVTDAKFATWKASLAATEVETGYTAATNATFTNVDGAATQISMMKTFLQGETDSPAKTALAALVDAFEAWYVNTQTTTGAFDAVDGVSANMAAADSYLTTYTTWKTLFDDASCASAYIQANDAELKAGTEVANGDVEAARSLTPYIYKTTVDALVEDYDDKVAVAATRDAEITVTEAKGDAVKAFGALETSLVNAMNAVAAEAVPDQQAKWFWDKEHNSLTTVNENSPISLRSLADVTVLTVNADGEDGYVLPLIQPYATSGGDATDIVAGAKVYNLQKKDAEILRATNVNKYLVDVKNGAPYYADDVDASNVYAQWIFIPGTSGFYTVQNRATTQVLYTGPVMKVKDANDKAIADTYVFGTDTLKLAAVTLNEDNFYTEKVGNKNIQYDYSGTFYQGDAKGVDREFTVSPVSPFLSSLTAQFNKDSVMVLGTAEDTQVWMFDPQTPTTYGVEIDGLPQLKKQTYKIYKLSDKGEKEYIEEGANNVYILKNQYTAGAHSAAVFEIRNVAEGQYQLLTSDGAKKMTINATPSKPILEVSVAASEKNDLFSINKAELNKYRKLTAEDGVLSTAKIYMENEPNRYLYENTANIVANNGNKIAKDSLNFLGIYNTAAMDKNAALFVDTAYVEREGVYMPQYMFALGVTDVPAHEAIACTYEHNHFDNAGNKVDAEHCSHATPATLGYKSGRYLVALTDSIEGVSKHPGRYDGETRLAFVDAIHRNAEDYLIIKNSKWTGNSKQIVAGKETTYASKDTIKIEDNKTKAMTFALEIADQSTQSFYLATSGNKYVRILNGVPVLTSKKDDAAIFNIEATTEEATANEAIEASAVQVIAGKGVVTVQGAAGKVVTVANILGQTIANQVAASDNVTIAAPAGVLVVTVDGEATKVVVK